MKLRTLILYLCLIAFVSVLLGSSMWQPVPKPKAGDIQVGDMLKATTTTYAYIPYLPDVAGVTNSDITQDNISQNICNKNWSTKSIRPSVSVTNKIKVIALARYNQEQGTNYKMADGELDHLISLELGGAPADPNNLWFEPYTGLRMNGQDVGAHTKDKVENELHKEVCTQGLPLDLAQQVISTDWTQVLDHMTPKLGGVINTSSVDPDDN